MSEQLTVLFEQLRGNQPPTPFLTPDQIRRRGRQRNHRQAIAAGSAVLAVAGLGAGWAIAGTASEPPPPATPLSPPPSPSASPSPADLGRPPSVAASRLLRPEDFPVAGVRASELEDGVREWPWVSVVGGCPEYRPADYPTVTNRHDARGLRYAAAEWDAWEIVESYPDAVANMADVRKAIATCPAYTYPGGVDIEQTVVAERFAGDDALLVRLRQGASIDYMVAVRVGPLVATVMYSDGPESAARDLAPVVASRLRP